MKIAVIQETYLPFIGGSSYRAHEVFRRLVTSGHEVDVYTARLSQSLKVNEVIDGVCVHRIETPGGLLKQEGEFRIISDVLRFTFGVFFRLLVTKKRYDIYEVNHCPIFPVFAVGVLSKVRRVPTSVTFHEVWKELWFSYIKNKVICYVGIFLERLTTRVGGHIVAVSEVTRERLMKCYGVPEKKISLISNGINLAMYQLASCAKTQHKIVYLGRLNRHKNVDLLVLAFKRIKNIISDATLDIAGNGTEKTKLESMCKNIPDVTFHGYVTEEQKVRLLSSAWLFVLPSIREGQGITLLEAMAGWTPTIAAFYEGTGVVSVIRHKENGLLVRPDVEDIANAILQYYKSPQFYEQVQKRGSQFVQALDWDAIALKHENLYRSILGEKTSTVNSWSHMSGERSLDNVLK